MHTKLLHTGTLVRPLATALVRARCRVRLVFTIIIYRPGFSVVCLLHALQEPALFPNVQQQKQDEEEFLKTVEAMGVVV